ncbi:MAG: DUF11 domain-containing protein [Thermoplasmata archaeon]|nr:MAG: DUF11 domain-containing protein [Thermoplasmata archaeon]
MLFQEDRIEYNIDYWKILRWCILAAGFVLLLILLVGMENARADTVVSGPVSGTWDATGSPYWVEGDIVVQDTQTLTINDGAGPVEVRFNGTYSLTVGEGVVGGALLAGGPINQVTFTGNDSMIVWDGILYMDSSIGWVNNSNIYQAQIAVDMDNSNAVVVRDTVIDGVYHTGVGSSPVVGIRIAAGTTGAIALNNQIKNVYDNSGNGAYGILVEDCSGNQVLDNTITDVGSLDGSAIGIAVQFLTSNTVVRGNTIDGVYGTQAGFMAWVAGLYMESNYDSVNTIENNDISNILNHAPNMNAPQAGGLVHIDSSGAFIYNNTIRNVSAFNGTSSGLLVVSSTNTIFDNNSVNNVSSDLDNYGVYIFDSYNLLFNNTFSGNISSISSTAFGFFMEIHSHAFYNYTSVENISSYVDYARGFYVGQSSSVDNISFNHTKVQYILSSSAAYGIHSFNAIDVTFYDTFITDLNGTMGVVGILLQGDGTTVNGYYFNETKIQKLSSPGGNCIGVQIATANNITFEGSGLDLVYFFAETFCAGIMESYGSDNTFKDITISEMNSNWDAVGVLSMDSRLSTFWMLDINNVDAYDGQAGGISFENCDGVQLEHLTIYSVHSQNGEAYGIEFWAGGDYYFNDIDISNVQSVMSSATGFISTDADTFTLLLARLLGVIGQEAKGIDILGGSNVDLNDVQVESVNGITSAKGMNLDGVTDGTFVNIDILDVASNDGDSMGLDINDGGNIQFNDVSVMGVAGKTIVGGIGTRRTLSGINGLELRTFSVDIISSFGNAYGMSLGGGSGYQISEGTISDISGDGDVSAILIDDVTDGLFIQITATGMNTDGTIATGTRSVGFDVNSNENITFENNVISNVFNDGPAGTNPEAFGIRYNHSYGDFFINNTINTVSAWNGISYGIYAGFSNDTIFYDNSVDNITSNQTSYGLYLENNEDNFHNETQIANVTSVNLSSFGIYVNDSNPIVNASVILWPTQDYGVYCENGSTPLVVNSTIASTVSDFYVDGNSHPVALNTSFVNSTVMFNDGISTLTVQWFLHVRVVESISGPGVAGANVRVIDNDNGTYDRSFVADAQGYVNWLVITEYMRDAALWTYYTPFEILGWNATMHGIRPGNISISMLVEVPLEAMGEPPMPPGITVEKRLDNSTVLPEGFVTYTIWYNNTGSSPIGKVWINDTFDQDLGIFSYTVTPTVDTPPFLSWEFTDVTPGSHSFEVVVQVKYGLGDGVVFSNYADYTALNQSDKVVGTSNSVSFTVSSSDINLQKNADMVTAQPGDTITYTIWYNNTGSEKAAIVWINESFDPNLTFITSSAEANRTGDDWTFYDVLPGPHSFTIDAQVNVGLIDGVMISNLAHLNYTDPNGWEILPGYDSNTVTTTVLSAALSIEKNVDNLTVLAEGYITYTIWYNNTGGANAKIVYINETFDANVTFFTSSAEANRIGDNWTFNDVTPGPHSFTIVVQVNAGVGGGVMIDNFVHLNYTDPSGNDIVPGMLSNTVTTMTVAMEAVMSLEKSVENKFLLPGEMNTYTIWYNNSGGAKANVVWVNDTLHTNITIITSSAEMNRIGSSWQFFDVMPGTHSLTVLVQLDDDSGLIGSIIDNQATLDYIDYDGTKKPGTTSNYANFTVISSPTIDHIRIEYFDGSLVTDGTNMSADDEIVLYARGYNRTVGPLGDVVANWVVNGGIGTLNITTGSSVKFNATSVGLGTVSATYTTMGNITGEIRIVPGEVVRIEPTPWPTVIDFLNNTGSFNATGYDADGNQNWSWTPVWTWDGPGLGTLTLVSPYNRSVKYDSTGVDIVNVSVSMNPSIYNSTEVNISVPPTIDYIVIMDAPRGTGNVVSARDYAVGATDIFYAAGFNHTFGYVEDVEVNWTSSNTARGTVVFGPSTSTTFTANSNLGGATTITATNDTLPAPSNSTGTLTILEPTVDYIRIRDTANNGGSEVQAVSFSEGDTDIFYAAAYNHTADFIGDKSVNWASSNTDAGDVGPATGAYTTFTAGSVSGTTIVTATYGPGITDETGTLTVTVVVPALTVDQIIIRDALSGVGNPLTQLSLDGGDTFPFYAAGYNSTTGTSVRDIPVTWTLATGLGSIDINSGYQTNLTASSATGTNATGNLTAAFQGITATVSLVVDLSPAAPANFAVTQVAEGGSLTLSWTASTEADVAGYRIYRSTESGANFTLLTTAVGRDSTSHTDTDLNDGTIYYYYIQAYDAGPNYSPATSEIGKQSDKDTDGDGQFNLVDTDDDEDGLSDTEEESLGTNPLLKDTDGDGHDDGEDDYPLDAEKWKKEAEGLPVALLIVPVIIIVVVVLLLLLLMRKRNPEQEMPPEEKAGEERPEEEMGEEEVIESEEGIPEEESLEETEGEEPVGEPMEEEPGEEAIEEEEVEEPREEGTSDSEDLGDEGLEPEEEEKGAPE